MEKVSNINIFNFDEDNSSSADDQKSSHKSRNDKNSKTSIAISDSHLSDEDEKEEKLDEEEIIMGNKTIEEGLLEAIKKKENVTKENLYLAEKINFKSSSEALIQTDEFGFIKDKGNNESTIQNEYKNHLSKTELLTINARTEKWRYMLEHIDVYRSKKRNKLKKRTRKGIPDSLRGYIWQLFSKKNKYYMKDLYQNLEKEKLDPETETTIIKDLDRTFPSCQLFKDKYGAGQRKLFKVLSNYSKYNNTIGYVQGMGYLVALFLIYMNEESSFYVLHSLIKDYELEGIYKQGFPDLKKKFYVLLNLEKKFIPKIYDVLKRDGIFPSIYASEWFICLFSKDLKINVLVRIFDTFLFEGFKVIYRFALAFLKMKEKQFTKGKPGIVYTMEIIKKCFEDIDIEALFKVAFSFHLSKKHINKFELEYEQNKNNANNEFIKQL
jgi:hypothetical protein